MVKAKDFLEFLCSELDYRFFSGVACAGFTPIYKNMSAEIMHYVPASNERIALAMAAGAHIAGFKGVVLTDSKLCLDLSRLVSDDLLGDIPILILTYVDGTAPKLNCPTMTFKSKSWQKDLGTFVKKLDKVGKPGLVLIGEGDIS